MKRDELIENSSAETQYRDSEGLARCQGKPIDPVVLPFIWIIYLELRSYFRNRLLLTVPIFGVKWKGEDQNGFRTI